MSEQAAEAEKPKGGGKKLLIIILAVVLLVVLAGGGAALYLLTSKPDAEKTAKKDKKDHGDEEEASDEEEEHEGEEKPPVYEKLESFTVNLSDGQTYLQVEVHLNVADIKVQEKLKARMPEVRNDVISILSSKSPQDLGPIEGRNKLAEEIKEKINGDILEVKKASKGVKKVLFNAFIIQ